MKEKGQADPIWSSLPTSINTHHHRCDRDSVTSYLVVTSEMKRVTRETDRDMPGDRGLDIKEK